MADTYPDITLIVSLIFSLSSDIVGPFFDAFGFFGFSFCSFLALFALTIVQDKVWYRQGEKK